MNSESAITLRNQKLPAWLMLILWVVYALVYTLLFSQNLEAILAMDFSP